MTKHVQGCMLCSARHPDRKGIPDDVIIKKSEKVVIVVGSHPKESDEEKGVIGHGGDTDVLLRYLDSLDATILITNSVLCRTRKDRTPALVEIRTCYSAYLLPLIEKWRPKGLLLLGKTAISSIYNTNKAKSKERLNTINRVSLYGNNSNKIWEGTVCSVYHPGYFKMSRGHGIVLEKTTTDVIKEFNKEINNGQ